MNPDSRSKSSSPTIAMIMGVAGVGKTVVGRMAADRLKWDFVDGDDYHPEANVRKMSCGVALTDDDRVHWLETLQALMRRRLDEGRSTVIACSALKAAYRRILTTGNEGVVTVYLKAPHDVVQDRIQERTAHFFNAALLRSQFEALEEPTSGIIIDATQPLNEVVDDVVESLSAL